MIYEFLSNQIAVPGDKTDIYQSNIGFKLELIEKLFQLSISHWPAEQKNSMRFQIDSGDTVSPVARAFPGGSYRIIFPVRIVYELDGMIFREDVRKHDKKSFESRVIIIALMLCLSHELVHCVRGHLDEDLKSSKSEETDADFMAGGALWGWINNQPELLALHGFGDEVQTAYEVGYAATCLCVLFQKYHNKEDGYHLPHQRLLTFNAGYMNPIRQSQGDLVAIEIGKKQETGINGAKDFLSSNGLSEYVHHLFDNENNKEDYFEVIDETQKKRDKDIDIWHRASFLLKPIKHLLRKDK